MPTGTAAINLGVDYGIEQTPSLPGSSKAQNGRPKPTLPRPATGAGQTRRAAKAKEGPIAPLSFGARAAVVMANLRTFIEGLNASFRANPTLLLRTIAFILSLVLMFGQRNIRERLSRILATSWGKVKATAGMGVKVSYI